MIIARRLGPVCTSADLHLGNATEEVRDQGRVESPVKQVCPHSWVGFDRFRVVGIKLERVSMNE